MSSLINQPKITITLAASCRITLAAPCKITLAALMKIR